MPPDKLQSKKNKKEKKTRKSEPESSNKSVERISCEDSRPTVQLEEKQEDLRRKLEEKSQKYSHLPVYDKTQEKRKADERRREMTAIFSDMDRQLETVTDLTSQHIRMKTSTPFDEDHQASNPHHDVHTLQYNKGVLNPRHSADQSQGDSDSKKEDNSEPSEGSQQSALPPYKRKIDPEIKDERETYESLGETFRQLKDKMETVTRDLKSEEIPYADEDDGTEDYPARTVSDGRKTYFWKYH